MSVSAERGVLSGGRVWLRHSLRRMHAQRLTTASSGGPGSCVGSACQLAASLLLLVASTQPAGAQDFRRTEYVELGGIDQWISIRGSSARNPIILIVHGGPGFSNAAHTSAFDSWQDDFTIVDWDQRGAGRTFLRNGPDGSGQITIERIAQDGVQLAGWLIRHFERDRVVVLGLSFGSIVALKMVTTQPSLFQAYVGTGQLVNRADGDSLGYQEALREAQRVGNQEALRALKDLGPPPWPDARTWNAAKGWAGRLTRPEDRSSRIRLNAMMEDLLNRGYTPEELQGIRDGARYSVSQLAPHRSEFDARVFAARIEIPVFVFQGENDLNTATGLAIEWFDALHAPRKELHIVAGGSHGAFYANSEEFLAFVVPRID